MARCSEVHKSSVVIVPGCGTHLHSVLHCRLALSLEQAEINPVRLPEGHVYEEGQRHWDDIPRTVGPSRVLSCVRELVSANQLVASKEVSEIEKKGHLLRRAT